MQFMIHVTVRDLNKENEWNQNQWSITEGSMCEADLWPSISVLLCIRAERLMVHNFRIDTSRWLALVCGALYRVNCDLCDPAGESWAVWSELSLPRRAHASTNSQNNTWPWCLAIKSMIIAPTAVPGIGALVIFLLSACIIAGMTIQIQGRGMNQGNLPWIFDDVKLGWKLPPMIPEQPPSLTLQPGCHLCVCVDGMFEAVGVCD